MGKMKHILFCKKKKKKLMAHILDLHSIAIKTLMHSEWTVAVNYYNSSIMNAVSSVNCQPWGPHSQVLLIDKAFPCATDRS